jgi:type I restriction enzyme S subunit
LNTGLTYKKENLSNNYLKKIRVLRGGNIDEFNLLLKDDDIMIDESYVKPDLLLRRNSLLTPSVTSLVHIGKIARVEKDMDDVTAGGFVFILSPIIEEEYFSKYLMYAMGSQNIRTLLREITNKSGQAFYNLSNKKMLEILIPIPPMFEQKRIVEKIEEFMQLVNELKGEVS